MDHTLFLCVDGGGTKTEALLADTTGNILGRGLAGGTNALSVGKNQATQSALKAVQDALHFAGGQPVKLLHLFIPGFPNASHWTCPWLQNCPATPRMHIMARWDNPVALCCSQARVPLR